jgi:hypothetical protein
MQHEPLVDTTVFNTLVSIEFNDTDRSRRGAWASETRLHMLALEFARYMPEHAEQLAQAGMVKLAA